MEKAKKKVINVAVAVEPTLLYQKGTDAVGYQLLIEYSIDEKTMITYSAVISQSSKSIHIIDLQ